MIDWQVESLRLTVFRHNPVNEVIPIWESFMGQKPTKVDSQPRENVIREEGIYEQGILVYTSNPLRIDWFLNPSQEQQTSIFSIIGPLLEVKNKFLNLMIRWLNSDKSPEIKRIAFGLVLLLPIDSRESAYQQLSLLLPSVKIDVKNSSELFYQINRPIESKDKPGLIINRLSKWSAMRTMGVGIIFDKKPEVIPDTRENIACRLELDVNTSQYYDKALSKDELTKIISEIDLLSEKIISEGDK